MSAVPGTVYLVGAGPGDPRLLTVRAVELIASVDVIVYDRLIPETVLENARPDAILEYVGKRPEEHTLDQERINELLVEQAQAGRSVVRLKGGDPCVFGRGGEEALALAEAQITFEIVPGITAGVAAPAYAGIPVTHRKVASAVTFVTGHEDERKTSSAIDWSALANTPGTLVLYMGVDNLDKIAKSLIEAGKDPKTAAAIIERGTMPSQKTVTAPLEEIAGAARAQGIEPPAATIIGPVAALREQLAWIEKLPLHGVKVAITRARAQASGLAAKLLDLGADVVQLPAIRIESLADTKEVGETIDRIAEYSLVCLTSPNGAELLFAALRNAGKDARSLSNNTVAAIGPGTSEALLKGGVVADVVPQKAVAEALADELEKLELSGKKVLLARAAEARDLLPKRLKGMGAGVDEVALYKTTAEPITETQLNGLAGADYLTFTSSSTVKSLLAAIGSTDRLPKSLRVVTIGPVTSKTAKELGFGVDVEAKQHDIDGLLDALIADV